MEKRKTRNNLAGNCYGILTVISFIGIVGKHKQWVCVCACGNSKNVREEHLLSGSSQSCGCKKGGKSSRDIPSSKDPTYKIWKGIKQRCFNRNNHAFANYGGRGITMVDRWLSYENFVSDMGVRPSGMSIDRIDNNGNYSPENCRWVNHSDNNKNKRNTKMITFNGETMPASNWADRLGILRSTLSNRLNILGWSVERALTEKPQLGNNQFCKLARSI